MILTREPCKLVITTEVDQSLILSSRLGNMERLDISDQIPTGKMIDMIQLSTHTTIDTIMSTSQIKNTEIFSEVLWDNTNKKNNSTINQD